LNDPSFIADASKNGALVAEFARQLDPIGYSFATATHITEVNGESKIVVIGGSKEINNRIGYYNTTRGYEFSLNPSAFFTGLLGSIY